jgi:hypothetical protein
MYSRFQELLAESDRDEFCEQLRRAKITQEDSGHTTFEENADCEAIDIDPFDSYLSGFYDDTDGQAVNVILHFVPPGVVSWVERFRLDHRPVKNPWPTSGDLRFSLHS